MRNMHISRGAASQLLEMVESQIEAIEPVVIFLQHQLGLPPKRRLNLPDLQISMDSDDQIKSELAELVFELEKYENLRGELNTTLA